MRRAESQVAGPVPGLRGVEHARRNRRRERHGERQPLAREFPATLALDGVLRTAPGGLLLGQNIESGPYPNRLQSIRSEALGEVMGAPLADAVFYQQRTPFFYHYQPNVMPPEKHRAYAVQWLGLALVVLVGGLVLTRRMSP